MSERRRAVRAGGVALPLVLLILGAPAKVVRADYSFQAVALPSGSHNVTLAFHSEPLARASVRGDFSVDLSAGDFLLLPRGGAHSVVAAEADTLLLTVPNQLGVDYNAHAIESILRYVAPELGWRDRRER